MDLDPKYNDDYFTPNFKALMPDSLWIPNFAVTTAFSSKSQIASVCGQHAAFEDFQGTEAAAGAFRKPCLPKLLANHYGHEQYSSAKISGAYEGLVNANSVAILSFKLTTYCSWDFQKEANVMCGYDQVEDGESWFLSQGVENPTEETTG